MAIAYKGEDISLPAGEDLSDDQFRIMYLSSGTVIRPNAGAKCTIRR